MKAEALVKVFSEIFKEVQVSKDVDENIDTLREVASSLTADIIEDDDFPRDILPDLYVFLTKQPDSTKGIKNLEKIYPSLLKMIKDEKTSKTVDKKKQEDIKQVNEQIDKIIEDSDKKDKKKESKKPEPKKKTEKKAKEEPKPKEDKKAEKRAKAEPKKAEKKTPKETKKAETKPKEEKKTDVPSKPRSPRTESGISKFIKTFWKKYNTLTDVVAATQEEFPSMDKKQVYSCCRWVRWSAKKAGKAEQHKKDTDMWRLL